MTEIDSAIFAKLNTISDSCWEVQQRFRQESAHNDAAEEALLAAIKKNTLEQIRTSAKTIKDDLLVGNACPSIALLIRITTEKAQRDLGGITYEHDLLSVIIADLNETSRHLHAQLQLPLPI